MSPFVEIGCQRVVNTCTSDVNTGCLEYVLRCLYVVYVCVFCVIIGKSHQVMEVGMYQAILGT